MRSISRTASLSFATLAQIVCAITVLSASVQNLHAGHGANELSVAGIRPGRDNISVAEKKIPGSWTREPAGSSGTHVWIEPCSNRKLSLEADDSGTIQSVTVESLNQAQTSACHADAKGASQPQSQSRLWTTGHGLRLGDTKQRVFAIYGKPGSAGPSVKNGRELELLYYAFDWAGPDVPQVMEISCDRATGRVVEIMLAFPSL
jgi:hypothetical protein